MACTPRSKTAIAKNQNGNNDYSTSISGATTDGTNKARQESVQNMQQESERVAQAVEGINNTISGSSEVRLILR